MSAPGVFVYLFQWWLESWAHYSFYFFFLAHLEENSFIFRKLPKREETCMCRSINCLHADSLR